MSIFDIPYDPSVNRSCDKCGEISITVHSCPEVAEKVKLCAKCSLESWEDPEIFERACSLIEAEAAKYLKGYKCL